MLTDPTLAIESVLAPEVRDAILNAFPGQRGATVADLLDIASDHDHGIEHSEPAWEEWGADVVDVLVLAHPDLSPAYLQRLVGLAMLTFVLTPDLPLAEDRVRDLAAAAAKRVEVLAA